MVELRGAGWGQVKQRTTIGVHVKFWKKAELILVDAFFIGTMDG